MNAATRGLPPGRSVHSPVHGRRIIRRMKTAVKGPTGERYILIINEDITEARRAQAELEQTHAFLDTIVESLPIGISVKDAETLKLVMTNPASDEIFGIERNANLGKANEEVFPPEQAERLDEADRRVATTGEPEISDEETGDDTIGLPSGSRCSRWRGRPSWTITS